MGENTPQGSNNTGNVLGWIEKLNNLIQKSGLQNIFLTIMVLFLVIVVGYVAFNPEKLVKKIEDIQQQQHTESVMKRIKVEPQIREALMYFRAEVDGDRAFLLETHNGGTNLANLPFLYVDLTFAEPKTSLSWLESEYKNVRLSRYPFASKMFDETYWFGPVSEIESIDPELYIRLEKEDVKYLGMMLMYGTYNPSGVIGVVYCDENIPSEAIIKKNLIKYASTISNLLNNE